MHAVQGVMFFAHVIAICINNNVFCFFCSGNGRPFAMEVLNPRIVSPDSSLLKEIQNIINRGEGLNAAKDVEVALLTQVYSYLCAFTQKDTHSLFSLYFLSSLRPSVLYGKPCRPKPRKSARATAAWCGVSVPSPETC